MTLNLSLIVFSSRILPPVLKRKVPLKKGLTIKIIVRLHLKSSLICLSVCSSEVHLVLKIGLNKSNRAVLQVVPT